MSGRHSDSKRHHSRFDPQPKSPKSKKYRRDDGYGNEHHSSSLHNKPNDSTQHAERGNPGQVARSSGQRKASERGWWKDSRNQLINERTETSDGREQRYEKSQTKLDDITFQIRDAFSEKKDDPPPTSRKKPAFRENKIPTDSGDDNLAAAAAVKSSQIDYPPQRNDRKKGRSINPHHLDRPEKHFADDRAPNKGEARRDWFPSRGRRYGGNDSYRGRDKFSGRQGYRPGNARTEKWKHDLYQEANKDPIPQNEDDQIAKLEALLAS